MPGILLSSRFRRSAFTRRSALAMASRTRGIVSSAATAITGSPALLIATGNHSPVARPAPIPTR